MTDWLDTKLAGEHLHLKDPRAIRAAMIGTGQAVRLGRQLRVDREALDAWLATQIVAPTTRHTVQPLSRRTRRTAGVSTATSLEANWWREIEGAVAS